MSLVNANTKESIPNTLLIHGTLPTQVGIDDGKDTFYYPLNTIERSGPLEFKIVCGEREAIDPNHIYLVTTNSITKGDGSVIVGVDDDNANVLPVNYLGATRFKDLEVTFNGTTVTRTNGMYPYKAIIETLVNETKDKKDNTLSMGLYDRGDDNDAHIDALDKPKLKALLKEENGYSRQHHVVRQDKFDMISPLHADIFEQSKILPVGLTVGIKLTPHREAFCLMSKNEIDYRLNLHSAKLLVRMVQVNPDIILDQEKLTAEGMEKKYPFRRTEIKYYSRAANLQDLSENNIVNGPLPRRILMGLVRADALHGSYKLDPFYFGAYNVRLIVLRVNGEPRPYEQIELNYGKGNYLMGMLSMLRGSNVLKGMADIGINRTNYIKGNVLYGFDLTPSQEPFGSSFEIIKEGTISLEIKLDEAYTLGGLALVVYCEYDSEVSIDKHGEVYITQ